MRSIQSRIVSLAPLVVAALGLVAPSAYAATACAPGLPAGVELVSVATIELDGTLSPSKDLLVEGQLHLTDGALLADGESVPVGARLAEGVLVNAGRRPLLLTFKEGRTLVLEPGMAIGVGEARCRCKCVCTAGTLTQTALFDCNTSADTCGYKGDACVWADDAGVHEGTYTDCKKVWVITAN